jgi:chromosome segregation ATPase
MARESAKDKIAQLEVELSLVKAALAASEQSRQATAKQLDAEINNLSQLQGSKRELEWKVKDLEGHVEQLRKENAGKSKYFDGAEFAFRQIIEDLVNDLIKK